MPTIFSFQQGSESRARQNEESPLLGRFRAVPADEGRIRRRSSARGWFSSFRSGSWKYATVNVSDDSDDEENGLQERSRFGRLRKLLVVPEQSSVREAVEHWWGRWLLLYILPALIAVVWCAIPFPTYPLSPDPARVGLSEDADQRAPGHGEPLVRLNFWFFLIVYYGFYDCVALLWITKLFHIYNLNWWPSTLGLPFTITTIIVVSLVIPIPIYYNPATRWLVRHNTLWVLLTFLTMLMPVVVAFGILLKSERYLGLQSHVSDMQKLFTSSTWMSGGDTAGTRTRQRAVAQASAFNPNAPLDVQAGSAAEEYQPRLGRRWIPASFVRFTWFCLAMLIGMLAYVLGEGYGEVYLRTLPHNNIETVIYVYSWVITIHVLDGLVGWILGGEDGERVGSYPLAWVFKLYFTLTYQTYVRALYARLRSPSQFAILQLLSSSSLIVLTPLSISRPIHTALVILYLNGQSYTAYKKFSARNIFIRSIAENVSMLAFLGEILVFHYISNKDVYPYLSFSDPDDPYTFPLTFWASSVTWACEIGAGWVVRRILKLGFRVDVTGEGKRDLVEWPELVPAGLAVMVHVLQNMLFSIIRLRFR